MNNLKQTWEKEANNAWKNQKFRLKLSNPPLSWFSKVNNKRLLEAGCGGGQYLYNFSKLGYRVFGIDLSKEILTICRDNCMGYHVKPILKLADVRNIPFKRECFDVVFSMGVIEHLEDYRKALKEMVRVTKKEGLIFIGVPYRYTFFVLAKILQQVLGTWKLGREKSFAILEIRKLLESENIKLIKIHRKKLKVGRHPYISGALRLMDELLFLVGLGGHFLYVLGRKEK